MRVPYAERPERGAAPTGAAARSPGGGGGSDGPHKFAILAILCSALLLVSLDATIVNVALPSIGRDLHARIAGLQWVIDAYSLVVASLLMLAGSTGDRIGRRRVFIVGMSMFALGSLLCSLAGDLTSLVVFRMVQATGGSMLTPVALSIVRTVFVEPRERAQAIGFWGTTFGAGLALGPVVGGLLVEALDWRAVFWINLPVCAVAIALTRMFVPESRAPRPRRLDPVGQVLVIATLAPLTYAIIEGPAAGWTSASILAPFVVAFAAFAGLILYEPRRREPLLELRFFRSVPFTGASVIAVCTFAAVGGFLLFNTIYLQSIRGYTALEAGLCTLPLAAMVIVLPPISGRLVGRGHARIALAIGGCGMAAGALLLTGLRATTPLPLLLVAYGVFGLGLGIVNVPITNTAVAGMPPAQAGVAASIASTSRQVGQTLGIAVIGATANTAAGGVVSPGFVAATHTGWWIMVACGAAVLVLGLLTTTAWARATARRATAGFGDDAPAAAGAGA